MNDDEQEERRRRDQESINNAVHQEDLSEVLRRDRAIRYLSLIWLLIVGSLLGYGMAACLGELVFGAAEIRDDS